MELDKDEPFVEILLLSKNSTYVAKKAKMFEAEKSVAEKAPVDGIKINDLNKKKTRKEKSKKEIIFLLFKGCRLLSQKKC